MAVTGTHALVLAVCTDGTSSASASASLARVRSAPDCVVSLDKADCVVSLDVVSKLGTPAVAVAVVAMSGSSGGLNCTLGTP